MSSLFALQFKLIIDLHIFGMNLNYLFDRYGAYLFKAFPLDISQFVGLFGATRIPLLNKDKIFRDLNSKHVLVQKGGNFYTFDVFDSDGKIF